MVRRVKRKTLYLVIVAITVVYLIPVLYILSMSFTSVGSPIGDGFFPTNPTFQNYIDVFESGIYTRYLLNGLRVSLTSSLIAVLVGFLAGYAMSRFQFPFKEKLFIGLIAVRGMPPVLMGIAFFQILVNMRLFDSLIALIILNTIFNTPLAVWMMRSFIEAIPKELDEAARIDGCNQFHTILRVVLPLSVTGLAAIFVQSFLFSWNEYMFAVTFINSEANKTPPVAIFDFIGQWATNYIGIMTFAVLLSMPVVIAFISVQRYFVKGLLSGSDK